jgi:protein phosphatase
MAGGPRRREGGVRFGWASGSHQGRIRDNNEDSIYPVADGRSDERTIVAVADGMGGHVAGEIASSLALTTAVELETATPEERVIQGNNAIMDAILTQPSLAGMGTTMTLIELDPIGRATIAHVGDSRAYRLRDGELEQLTRDHTYVAMQIAAGAMTEAEAARHPQRGVLTRALGLGRDVDVDISRERLRVGDRLLLCSDGLNVMLDNDTIAELLGTGSANEAVWALIEAANQAGGHDNVSVLVVEILT